MLTMSKSKFIPSDSDKQWLIGILNQITDEGYWITDYATYQKRGGALVCLKSVDEELNVDMNKIMNPIDIERNINRDKIVAQAIGMTFIDNRVTRNN